MSDHHEQRRSERITAPASVQVLHAEKSQSLGALVNISEDGLMVLGDPGVIVGHTYPIKIPLEERFVEMRIECLWVSSADADDKIWSGYAIAELPEEGEALLAELIRSLAF